MSQHIFTFFLDFLAREAAVIGQVRAYDGCLFIEHDNLVFSLVALHDFLGQSSKEKIPYPEFLRMLYQSTLNQNLKARGAQLVVHHSTGKIETSLYRLERITPADSSR